MTWYKKHAVQKTFNMRSWYRPVSQFATDNIIYQEMQSITHGKFTTLSFSFSTYCFLSSAKPNPKQQRMTNTSNSRDIINKDSTSSW